ncbi:MAG: DUF4142 domain-containing protein [Bdellovibrio sp.]|nr:DUF4142 domain-containing protein [Bdellovibrio sp.]
MKKTMLAFIFAFAMTPILAYAEDAPAATAMPPAITDNQIAEVMKTANMAEIDAAKVAKSKSKNQQVKEYAEHMIVEHRQNDKDAKILAKKVDIKPKSNDIARGIKKDAKIELADLKKMSGADFDKGYMKMQIGMHQELLNDLDQKFIPAAQNTHFKEFLQTTRTHVAAHLAKAQEVQIDISK